MDCLVSLPLLLLLLLSSAQLGRGNWSSSSSPASNFSRDDFPPGFVFGAGTSAYQVEGAVDEDGKGPSIWDTFTHAGKMPDGSTADVTADEYHKYKEDVKLMEETGLEAYRLSISWSRLIPNGRGNVNPKGLAYYNNLFDQLLMHGIQPHVTLNHLDLPQALEDKYNGWLSPRIIDDFTAYADVCFREFGDRVFYWTTINEPNVMSLGSYDNGLLPPQRCSQPFGIVNCTVGNSTVEPYIAVHYILLAHAAAANLYRTKYQAMQKGWIGANVYTLWFSPLTDSSSDADAMKRALDFYVGWIMNPLVFGDYPETMKKNAGSRLPSFTESQSKQVKGSFDFVGINHYTTLYVGDNPRGTSVALRDFQLDTSVVIAASKNDTPGSQYVPISSPTDPSGLQHILEYITRMELPCSISMRMVMGIHITARSRTLLVWMLWRATLEQYSLLSGMDQVSEDTSRGRFWMSLRSYLDTQRATGSTMWILRMRSGGGGRSFLHSGTEVSSGRGGELFRGMASNPHCTHPTESS